MQVRSFKSIFVMVLSAKMLAITKVLSDQVQDESLDLAAAGRLVEYVISMCTLKTSREHQDWEKTWSDATNIATLLGVDIAGDSYLRRKQRSQIRHDDMVVYETTGRRDHDCNEASVDVPESEQNVKGYFRVTIY